MKHIIEITHNTKELDKILPLIYTNMCIDSSYKELLTIEELTELIKTRWTYNEAKKKIEEFWDFENMVKLSTTYPKIYVMKNDDSIISFAYQKKPHWIFSNQDILDEEDSNLFDAYLRQVIKSSK